MGAFASSLRRGVGAGLLALGLLLAPLHAEPLSIVPQPAKTAPPVETASLQASEIAVVPTPVAPAPSVFAEPVMPAASVYAPESLYGREKINVVIFGDSLGDGVWAGLYHLLRSDKRFNVIRKSKVATGFVRQDYFNWNDEVKSIAENTRIDIAIIVIGTNDRQTIVDGRKRYALFEPKWREIYEARIDAFTVSLQATGAHIFWLELPVMRQARFESDMSSLNEIFAARARANGIDFVRTRDLAIDENGAYSAYGQDLKGKKRLLRSEDGIHFTMSGYELISSPLASYIRDVSGESGGESYQVAQVSQRSQETSSDVTGSLMEEPEAEKPRVNAQSIGLKPRLDDTSALRPGRSDDWRWSGDAP